MIARRQGYDMTYEQAHKAMAVIVLIGGVALLALAASAALEGVWPAAAFIGLAGGFLVGTVVLVKVQSRRRSSSRS